MADDSDPCRLCNHPRSAHTDWWDVPDSDSSPGGYCGFGCVVCGCDDFEPKAVATATIDPEEEP